MFIQSLISDLVYSEVLWQNMSEKHKNNNRLEIGCRQTFTTEATPVNILYENFHKSWDAIENLN